jgi:O-antigen ligase
MIEQATTEAGSLSLRIGRIPLWTIALAIAITYIAIVTGDGYILRVPVKLYLVAAAIGIWWLQVGRRRSLRSYELALPILAFALAIPVIWSLIALLHESGNDPVGIHRVTWTLQEDSRFVYMLLYFPLIDARRLFGQWGVNIWLIPVLALGGITIAIFLCHYVIGQPDSSIEYLVFKGVFEGNPGGFRVFIGNQVLFIAGVALLLSELAVRGTTRFRVTALSLLVFSTYLSHTRGIWLGLSVVCAGALLVLLLRQAGERDRRLLIGVAAGIAGLVAIAAVAMLARAIPLPSFLGDASAGSRVDQAPKLWDAFKGNPVFGDGFGAVIRPRYIRDSAAPWSYELTYLQILFQVGVLGLIAILALPLAAIWRGLRESVAGDLRSGPLAGTLAIVGILLASATNPYLLSSFGMRGLAIGLSLVGFTELPSTAATEEPQGRGAALSSN